MCVVLITETQIYCANSGDTRAVLSNSAVAHPLSFDHKPEHENERKRIIAANHTVAKNRVDGILSLSRAIGDFGLKDHPDLSAEKQAVTALPDVTCRARDLKD